MTQRKKFSWNWLFVVLVIAILLFAKYQFLHTSDGYGQYQITGKEVIEHLPHFQLYMWLGVFGMVVFLVMAYLNDSGAWIGKYVQGYMEVTILLIFLALACLIAPWIRAFDVKANGGVDLPKIQTSTHETRTTHSSTNRSICYYSSYGIPLKG